MSIFKNWTDEHTQKFDKGIFTVDHTIESSGLFTDEALIELLDKHPHNMLDVCTMGEHEIYQNQFRTGDFRDCDSATLLQAVKDGRLWLNVRRAMNLHPEYNALLKEMYGALAEKTGQTEFNANGGILISSPVAKVPYHADKTHVLLWHIRGTKKIYVYPTTQEFMSDESYERILTNTLIDDLPYKNEFDASATVLTLTGGEMAAWQLNQPHKVINETFCVSVTTEYSTRKSGFKNAAMFAQSLQRQKFGGNPTWDTTAMPSKVIKSIFGKAIKKAGLYTPTTNVDYVTFKVDKNVPGYIADIEPVARDF
ncbi:MAG: hypothetical protein COA43_13760 [Robiginitomaculum sp.]|nr:MAG: hypothetical protein COA43_13760 [Robiginitomaculum sp.]